MKKGIVVLITAIVVLGVMICIGAFISKNRNDSVDTAAFSGISWDKESRIVFKPAGSQYGAYYPRMIVLKNGTWLIAYDTNENAANTRCQVSCSEDKGMTWKVLSVASFGTGDAANAQMLQLKNGDLLLAYRLVNGDRKTLKVSLSRDNGKTWCEQGIIADVDMPGRGVWEPHMGFLPDGKLAVMYASEAYQPDFPQVIEMKVSDDNGKTWSSPIRVSGNEHSRDGMPVWTLTKDRKVLVVFEATDDPDGIKPFIIRYKISDDGYDWSGSREILYSPENSVARAAAPYVVRLKNNVLLASAQVDCNVTGYDMHILWSADNGKTWTRQAPAFETAGDDMWNALYSLDDGRVVALTSTNVDGNSHIEMKFGFLNMKQR